MLLNTLSVSLLGNLLTSKGVMRAGESTLELVKEQLEQARIFNAPHFLTNFEIQGYYQKEPKFNGVYSRKTLPKIKDGAYVINLDE